MNIHSSAKHLIGALAFHESAMEALKSGAKGLAAIGTYYTGYHLGVSILWLCDDVSPADMNQIGHDKLRELVSKFVVQRGLLEQEFLDDLDGFRAYRGYMNYSIYDSIRDAEEPFEFDLLLPKCQGMIDAAVNAIHSLLSEDALWQYQVGIGDGFGEDIIHNQVSGEIADRVQARLVELELTT